jgi:hypothetical protein
MNRGDSASPYSVRRSRRPQARLETSCTRTGRPRRHLRPSLAARRRAKAQAVRPACTSLRSHTAEYYLLLPMNHSNKDGKPLAESAEERPLIRRTLVNLTRTRRRAGRACPRGWRVCGKQQKIDQICNNNRLFALAISVLVYGHS